MTQWLLIIRLNRREMHPSFLTPSRNPNTSQLQEGAGNLHDFRFSTASNTHCHKGFVLFSRFYFLVSLTMWKQLGPSQRLRLLQMAGVASQGQRRQRWIGRIWDLKNIMSVFNNFYFTYNSTALGSREKLGYGTGHSQAMKELLLINLQRHDTGFFLNEGNKSLLISSGCPWSLPTILSLVLCPRNLNVINSDPQEFRNSQSKKIIQNTFHFGCFEKTFLLEKQKNTLRFRMLGFILIARFYNCLLN